MQIRYKVVAFFSGMLCLGFQTSSLASPAVTTYPIPTHASGAFFLATGPDDSVWFSEIDANKIGRIAKDGSISEFALPHPGSQPARIIEGADGAMWFAEYAGDRIGRITQSGSITEFAIPTAGAGPYGLANGPHASVWFTEQHAHGIGEVTPAGTVREFPMPAEGPDHCPIAPAGIARNDNAGFWAVDSASQHFWRIGFDGRMLDVPPQWPASTLTNFRSGSPTCLNNPSTLSPSTTAASAAPPDIFEDAALMNRAYVIVPVKPGEFAMSMSGSGSYAVGDPMKRLTRVQAGWGGPVTDIAAGAGMVAFTDTDGQVVWTLRGKTSTYNVLVRAKPAGIAIGLDGTIWVCANGFNAIMRIRP